MQILFAFTYPSGFNFSLFFPPLLLSNEPIADPDSRIIDRFIQYTFACVEDIDRNGVECQKLIIEVLT